MDGPIVTRVSTHDYTVGERVNILIIININMFLLLGQIQSSFGENY